MNIVILEGYVNNPGDLSWDAFTSQGELTVYDATPQSEALARIGDAEFLSVGVDRLRQVERRNQETARRLLEAR